MATTSRSSPVGARFDDFRVELDSGKLLRSGERVLLQEQPFQVLRLLLEAEGRVVTREQLRASLWPKDTFVDFERGVNTAVKKVRQALGDSAETPTFVETLPKIGYRFMLPVDWEIDTGEKHAPHSVVPISQPAPRPDPQPIPPNLRATVAIAILACATIGVLYLWVAPKVARLKRQYQLQQLSVIPLTTLPGKTCAVTFSPDGSQIAFLWDGGHDDWNLYVKVIGNEKVLRISHLEQWFGGIGWSPDGQSIAAVKTTPALSGVYLISPIGGAERKVAGRSGGWFDDGNEISWSPDGKKLAFLDDLSNSPSIQSVQLFVLSLDTLEKTPVKTDCDVVATPAFSPNGDYLAWVCVDNLSSNSIRIMRLRNGSKAELVRKVDSIGGIAWTRDSKRIVFTSPSRIGNLWEVSLEQPNLAERLPFGHDAFHVAISPARNRLAYAQMNMNINIYRVGLVGPHAQAQKVVSSSREQASPSFSPDGTQIAFHSNRSGNNEVWVSDVDGSNALKLSSFGISMTGNPRWSPDGKLIAFESRAGGQANLYLVDPRGGVPRKLNMDITGNNAPSWSHNGKWIYFTNGEDARSPAVWKIPSVGGHAVQIAKNEASRPIESPDGKYVYFNRHDQLWRVKTDGTVEEKVEGMPELGGNGEVWSPYGSGIYFMNWQKPKPEIDFFDLSTKKLSTILVLEKYPPDWSGSLPVSNDGKVLLFSQVDSQSSDLMMIENWK